ncbi:MAG: hypothetical protein ACRD06_06905 [Terriglobia bacterium]
MGQISIGDVSGSVQIEVAGSSLLAKNQLSALTTAASTFNAALPNPVGDSTFKDAACSAAFNDASISLSGGNTLGIKTSVNSKLSVSRASDSPLFGPDDYDPVSISANDCWAGFELDTLLAPSVAVPLPDGFGVSFGVSTAPSFAIYVLIPGAQTPATTLERAVQRTLNTFSILDSSADVLSIPEGVIFTNDISGTVKVGASWSLPLAVNQLSLAAANLPFNSSISVNPAVTLSVGGDVCLSGEFSVRFRRCAPNLLRVGLYKKTGTTVDASFTASAGLAAGLGNTDLINAFFSTIAPGVTISDAPDGHKIQQVLNNSVDRSLNLAFQTGWSGAPSQAAAMVYEIDIAAGDQPTKDAISSALGGDWSGIKNLRNARELRNVIIDTVEKKFTLTVNILGLFNYECVDDFVSAMRVVTDPEHGSVVITDSATAAQIAAASTPLAANPDKLRRALDNCFVATATYKALLAGIGASATFDASQTYFEYTDATGYRDALKRLNTGEALGVMQPAAKAMLSSTGAPVQHARFAASVDYDNDDVLRFFFKNIGALTPRTADELKKIGRNVLAGLLDPQDQTDQLRIAALQSDQQWAIWDANPAQVPVTPAPYYSDWFDITQWAEVMANVAPALKDVIAYATGVRGDPTADPVFMNKRNALALALDGATKNTKAGFNQNFPLCVMATLAGRTPGAGEPPFFEAGWNGKDVFSNVSPSPSPAQSMAARGAAAGPAI